MINIVDNISGSMLQVDVHDRRCGMCGHLRWSTLQNLTRSGKLYSWSIWVYVVWGKTILGILCCSIRSKCIQLTTTVYYNINYTIIIIILGRVRNTCLRIYNYYRAISMHRERHGNRKQWLCAINITHLHYYGTQYRHNIIVICASIIIIIIYITKIVIVIIVIIINHD